MDPARLTETVVAVGGVCSFVASFGAQDVPKFVLRYVGLLNVALGMGYLLTH